ncbi:MAG: MotA/TolQ/ExbB proton channel family protein [Opitutales bacterium]
MKIHTFRLIPTFIAILALALASQWIFTQSLNAQADEAPETETEEVEAAAEDEEAAAEGEEAGGQSQTLLGTFQDGGWAMYPLLLFSIAGFGLIVYNFMAIKAEPILKPEVTPEIDQALQQRDIEKARSICEEHPAPLTNIVSAGLNRANMQNYDAESVKEAMEEASSEELSGPFVYINFLSVVGSLSPMLGLLGTVSGMVKAFNVIQAEGAGSAQALAGNISEALITTATGMIIGIPTMFFFFFFKNKYGKITSRVARIVGDLQHTLTNAAKAR